MMDYLFSEPTPALYVGYLFLIIFYVIVRLAIGRMRESYWYDRRMINHKTRASFIITVAAGALWYIHSLIFDGAFK